ncbi:MAG TPA: AbgT family transporter, partial [Candidatus Eisenbacteria bacterium]|nr:AbgT family transporter [Candidatus Eisenbacteria bacterium]
MNEPENGFLTKLLDRVERWGNKLPHPFNLFLLLSAGVLVLSWVAHVLGLSVTHPVTGKLLTPVNLLDRQGIQNILTKAVSNFTGFAPLGTVLVAMIGVGVAERSGLIAAALGGLVRSVPRPLVTFALLFAGVNASLAVDAGYVILIPLGAVLFLRVGRHPLAGLAAAFAGVSAGFSANLFLTPIDPLLAGLTQEAARLYDPRYTVAASANYYFMAASTVLLSAVGTAVTGWLV